MKVIFLDFDGVINNWHSFDEIDISNILILREIINKTNAVVVAITSLKYPFQRGIVKFKETKYYKYLEVLNKYGIVIDDITPYIDENKEKEIYEYLNLHPEIEEFLILDDENIFPNNKEHQVLIELYSGLMKEHINPSIAILNGNLGLYPNNSNYNESLEDRLIRINKYYNQKK